MSQIRPSSLPMLAQCPYFESAGDETEASERGKKMHTYFADKLIDKYSINVNGMLETECNDVIWAVGFVRDRLGAAEVNVEYPISIVDDYFVPIIEGTADAFGVANLPTGDTLILFDLKTGKRRDHSLQLKAYAWGLMDQFGMSICQAHCLYTQTREVESMNITLKDARESVLAVIEKAKEAASGRGERKINEYCPWCQCYGKCDMTKSALEKVSSGYAENGKGEFHLSSWHPSALKDPAEMAVALEASEVLAKWADSVKHHAVAMASKGAEIPGWRLAEGRRTRSIADVNAAFNASGLPPEKFLPCVKLSVPALEKALSDNPKTKDTKAAFNRKLGDLIFIETSSPTLKRIHDKEKENGED